MKFLALILSIYILALNFAPCEDNSTSDNDTNTKISQNIDFDHQHSNSDLCSPFCQCCCCHIHAIDFNFDDLKLTISETSTEVFFHIYGLEKNFNNSILQPPRV